MGVPATDSIERKRRVSTGQIVAFAFGIIVVVGDLRVRDPEVRRLRRVWAAMQTLTPLEFWSLMARR